MHSRDFTVAVFVVRDNAVLLHKHKRLQRWLPPGGHIEPNELPDDAAIREVLEETGVSCVLVGPALNPIDTPGQPRQLTRPVGIQLADIGGDGHQHIDLVYIARGLDDGDGRGNWIGRQALDSLSIDAEVLSWCLIALNDVTKQT